MPEEKVRLYFVISGSYLAGGEGYKEGSSPEEMAETDRSLFDGDTHPAELLEWAEDYGVTIGTKPS